MAFRQLTLAIGLCTCPAVSAAQAPETIAFDIRFSDPVLTPGETQRIEMWVILNPTPGTWTVWNPGGGSGLPALVRAFAGARFDLDSVQNGNTGVFSELALGPDIAWWPGSVPGAPNGSGGVTGVYGYQLNTGPSAFNGSNPLLIWSALWTPDDYTTRTVEFATGIQKGPDAYLDVGASLAVLETWAPITPHASFQVVPAPGPAIMLGLGLIPFGRRRRRDGAS